MRHSCTSHILIIKQYVAIANYHAIVYERVTWENWIYKLAGDIIVGLFGCLILGLGQPSQPT